MYACLTAAPPLAHAASTLYAGISPRPLKSTAWAPRCSWPVNRPADMFPITIPSISEPGTPASKIVYIPASRVISLRFLSQSSPNFDIPTPAIATLLLIL